MEDILVKNYPQLQFLLWSRPFVKTISCNEAFEIYESNWRHVDSMNLQSNEKELIMALIEKYGAGVMFN